MLTKDQRLDIAHQAIQKARDIITEVFYEGETISPNMTPRTMRALIQMDKDLRDGYADNETIKKYAVAYTASGGYLGDTDIE